MESRYVVSLKKTDAGYSVWAPGLPDCASQGDTEQEALENIADAIREYLDVVDELAAEAEGDRREVTVVR
jgi:predicted RNase H-like HicB family nuclease